LAATPVKTPTLGELYDRTGAAEFVRVRRKRKHDESLQETPVKKVSGKGVSSTQKRSVFPAGVTAESLGVNTRTKGHTATDKTYAQKTDISSTDKAGGYLSEAFGSLKSFGVYAYDIVMAGAGYVADVVSLAARRIKTVFSSMATKDIASNWHNPLAKYAVKAEPHYSISRGVVRRRETVRPWVPITGLSVLSVFLAGALIFSLMNSGLSSPISWLSSPESKQPGNQISSSNQSASDTGTACENSKSSVCKSTGSSARQNDPANSAATENTTQNTSRPSNRDTTQTTNVPLGGLTGYLPPNIPGVTSPVTVTVPGQTVTADGKPVVITPDIPVTLN